MKEYFLDNNIAQNKKYIDKCKQLYSLVKSSMKGIMVVGEAGSGKSVLLKNIANIKSKIDCKILINE
jgi:ABC-type bacteriocin/lantibiotic exporter with double-glycine peptidase domain